MKDTMKKEETFCCNGCKNTFSINDFGFADPDCSVVLCEACAEEAQAECRDEK